MKKAKRMKNTGQKCQMRKNKEKAHRVKQFKLSKVIIGLILAIALILTVLLTKDMFHKEGKAEEKGQETNVNSIYEEEIKEKQITQERNYKKMRIKNIKIYEEKEQVYFSAEIQNTTKNTFKKRNVTIAFIDKEKESIVEYRIHLKEIKPKETITIKLMANRYIKQAYDFKIIEDSIIK